MYPILFEVGQFKFYSFGTFIALGAFIGGVILVHLAKSRKLKTHHLFDTVLYTLLLALVGARITYYFIYNNQFQSSGQILYFWQGGLIALGGFFVGFLTYLFFIRREKDPLWPTLDIGALALLPAWALGKLGCFLSTCTVGRPGTGFLTVNNMYPIDLYSAIWALLLFGFLYATWLRKKLSEGVIFFLALEGLFLGELLIKTLKIDFGENIARIEAIILLVIVVSTYLIFWKIHGPKIERTGVRTKIRNLVFRRKQK
jgi:phosphatidylglycerol:prolipoprotein diacylglycerol transferase